MNNHTLHVCTDRHEDGGWGCMFCAGGLSMCDVCSAFEGAWPDDCPGNDMDARTIDLVYTGRLNYRDGWWRVECCQVMRHVHDRVAYMAEHGYTPTPTGGWSRSLERTAS